MSNLVRWEPLGPLAGMREAMERWFEEFPTRPLFGQFTAKSPEIDVYQTDEEVVFEVSLPGIKPEEVDVSITGGSLTIRGEKTAEKEEKEADYYLRERRYGSFTRSILLPADVDSEKSLAEFKDGILTITLPKTEEVKAKKIPVTAK